MAKEPDIRKLVTFREVIRSEGGRELEHPLKKCAVAAVIKNPFAGKYEEDLTLLMEYGESWRLPYENRGKSAGC